MNGNIYDFSFYAKRKAAVQAAAEVACVFQNLNNPGSILQIKHKIGIWFELNKELCELEAVA